MQHLNILKSNLVKLVLVSFFSLVCLVDCGKKDKEKEEAKFTAKRSGKTLTLEFSNVDKIEGGTLKGKINDKEFSITLKQGETANVDGKQLKVQTLNGKKVTVHYEVDIMKAEELVASGLKEYKDSTKVNASA